MSISARFVCWNCRRSNTTLHNVKDEYGLKSEDYVCSDCKPLFPTPTRKNMSREFMPTKEQIDAMMKAIEDTQRLAEEQKKK